MKKRLVSYFAAAWLTVYVPVAFGHGEHCHTKGADGKITDVKGVKGKKACAKKGGVWEHHHQHCHKNEGDKHVDLEDQKTEETCKTAGGTWSDHGHD